MHSAQEQEVVRSQAGAVDPRMDSLSGSRRELKLHRTLGLLLHHRRPRCNLLPLAYVPEHLPY